MTKRKDIEALKAQEQKLIQEAKRLRQQIKLEQKQALKESLEHNQKKVLAHLKKLHFFESLSPEACIGLVMEGLAQKENTHKIEQWEAGAREYLKPKA